MSKATDWVQQNRAATKSQPTLEVVTSQSYGAYGPHKLTATVTAEGDVVLHQWPHEDDHQFTIKSTAALRLGKWLVDQFEEKETP